MKDYLEYYSVKLFIFLIGFLPKSAVYRILEFLSRLLFKFEKKRSRITVKNLALAFPDKNMEEIYEIALKAYKSVSITLTEIILMLNNKINLDDMVEGKEEFLEKMQKYTNDTKNGVVIITAHFSNWELAAQYLPMHGYPMVAIGREGNNKLIEKNITTPFRQRYGNKNVYKKNALLSIIKALKKGKFVGLLFDQKAGNRNKAKVNFFNKPADTTNSIAEIKLKFNPKIIPVFFPRNKQGKYIPIIFEPVEYVASEEEDKDEKLKKMTQKYNDILEEVIREYPEQWFWMHNRWRLT